MDPRVEDMKKIDSDPLGEEAGHTAHDHQNILPLLLLLHLPLTPRQLMHIGRYVPAHRKEGCNTMG
jgi:hypothetical protein